MTLLDRCTLNNITIQSNILCIIFGNHFENTNQNWPSEEKILTIDKPLLEPQRAGHSSVCVLVHVGLYRRLTQKSWKTYCDKSGNH